MVLADLHSNTLFFDPIFGGDPIFYQHFRGSPMTVPMIIALRTRFWRLRIKNLENILWILESDDLRFMNSETLLLLAKVLSSPEYVTALISTSLISFIGYRCLTFTTLSSSSYPLTLYLARQNLIFIFHFLWRLYKYLIENQQFSFIILLTSIFILLLVTEYYRN